MSWHRIAWSGGEWWQTRLDWDSSFGICQCLAGKSNWPAALLSLSGGETENSDTSARIGFNEQVECLLGVRLGLGLQSRVQGLRAKLRRADLGRHVEHGMTLCSKQRCWRVLGRSLPVRPRTPSCTVTDGQLRDIHSSVTRFNTSRQLWGDSRIPPPRSPRKTLALRVHSRRSRPMRTTCFVPPEVAVAIAVGPDVDPTIGIQTFLAPRRYCSAQDCFNRDTVLAETVPCDGVPTVELLGRGVLAAGDAFQIQHVNNACFQRLRTHRTSSGRYLRRSRNVTASPVLTQDLRNLHRDRTQAESAVRFWLITVAHRPPLPVSVRDHRAEMIAGTAAFSTSTACWIIAALQLK